MQDPNFKQKSDELETKAMRYLHERGRGVLDDKVEDLRHTLVAMVPWMKDCATDLDSILRDLVGRIVQLEEKIAILEQQGTRRPTITPIRPTNTGPVGPPPPPPNYSDLTLEGVSASGAKLVLALRAELFTRKLGRVSVGQSERNTDVTINDARVADRHAAIAIKKDGIYVHPYANRVGTSLNGKALTPGFDHKINIGDTLALGPLKLVLRKGAAR